jgi:hypothetical protein
LERIAPAVAVEQGRKSFGRQANRGAGRGNPNLSGKHVGDGAVRGCAGDDNHLHPPFGPC